MYHLHTSVIFNRPYEKSNVPYDKCTNFDPNFDPQFPIRFLWNQSILSRSCPTFYGRSCMSRHFFAIILKSFRILQKVTDHIISVPTLTPILTPKSPYDFSEIRVFSHAPALHFVGESAWVDTFLLLFWKIFEYFKK